MKRIPKARRIAVVAEYLAQNGNTTQEKFAQGHRIGLSTFQRWIRMHKTDAVQKTISAKLNAAQVPQSKAVKVVSIPGEFKKFSEALTPGEKVAMEVLGQVERENILKSLVNGIAHAVTIKLPSGAIINIPFDAPKETFEMVFALLRSNP